MAVFLDAYDYKRFLKTTFYYQIEGPKARFSIFAPTSQELDKSRKIVEIACYCLMPNHFHFLLKQVRGGGITEFVSKLSNSYTKYFNTKNKRVGPLFQGEFKSVHVGTLEQLLHLSRYIHLNPLVDYVSADLDSYRWSSYREFLSIDNTEMCFKEIILGQFGTVEDYREFILDQVGYAKELERIKHELLDTDP